MDDRHWAIDDLNDELLSVVEVLISYVKGQSTDVEAVNKLEAIAYSLNETKRYFKSEDNEFAEQVERYVWE